MCYTNKPHVRNESTSSTSFFKTARYDQNYHKNLIPSFVLIHLVNFQIQIDILLLSHSSSFLTRFWSVGWVDGTFNWEQDLELRVTPLSCMQLATVRCARLMRTKSIHVTLLWCSGIFYQCTGISWVKLTRFHSGQISICTTMNQNL